MRPMYLRMWYCGDEYCKCEQPKFSFGPYKPFWEGPFHSEPDEEERKEVLEEVKSKIAEMILDKSLTDVYIAQNDFKDLWWMEGFDWTEFDKRFPVAP